MRAKIPKNYKLTAILQVGGKLSLMEKDFEDLSFDPEKEADIMTRNESGVFFIHQITVWRRAQMGNWLPEFTIA
jgi:hypothetical protein